MSTKDRQHAAWRRRQSIQVAAMLPDDPKDALAVLRGARRVVRSYLTGKKKRERKKDG